MSKYEFLTDEQWAVLEPLIPVPKRRPDGRGRPWKPNREVLAGILWILRTGAAWQHLPGHFPPYQTCHRRFQKWVREGVMRSILEALARDLEERGQIDLSECFIDGTFVVAKKGVPRWERPSGARVRSSWLFQTLLVFHSDCTRLLLLHMRSPLSKLPSLRPSPYDDPDALSEIAPTTVIRSIRSLLAKELS
jgi:transposase